MHRDVVRWNELVLRCESAKRRLSTAADAAIEMKDAFVTAGGRRDFSVAIDRNWAETCWSR